MDPCTKVSISDLLNPITMPNPQENQQQQECKDSEIAISESDAALDRQSITSLAQFVTSNHQTTADLNSDIMTTQEVDNSIIGFVPINHQDPESLNQESHQTDSSYPLRLMLPEAVTNQAVVLAQPANTDGMKTMGVPRLNTSDREVTNINDATGKSESTIHSTRRPTTWAGAKLADRNFIRRKNQGLSFSECYRLWKIEMGKTIGYTGMQHRQRHLMSRITIPQGEESLEGVESADQEMEILDFGNMGEPKGLNDAAKEEIGIEGEKQGSVPSSSKAIDKVKTYKNRTFKVFRELPTVGRAPKTWNEASLADRNLLRRHADRVPVVERLHAFQLESKRRITVDAMHARRRQMAKVGIQIPFGEEAIDAVANDGEKVGDEMDQA